MRKSSPSSFPPSHPTCHRACGCPSSRAQHQSSAAAHRGLVTVALRCPAPGWWGLHPGQVPPPSPVGRAETSQRILGICCLHWTLDEVSKAGSPEEQYQEVSPCISPRPGLCFLQHFTRALPSLSRCPVSLPFPFLP